MAPPHKAQTRTYNTRFKPEEWEARRSRICGLFLAPRNTLEIVARIMREDEGFNATVKQYKDRLRVWGVRKYRSNKRRGVAPRMREQKDAPKLGGPGWLASILGQHELDVYDLEGVCSNTNISRRVQYPKPKEVANPVLPHVQNIVAPEVRRLKNYELKLYMDELLKQQFDCQNPENRPAMVPYGPWEHIPLDKEVLLNTHHLSLHNVL